MSGAFGEGFIRVRPDTSGFGPAAARGTVGPMAGVAKKLALTLAGAFAVKAVAKTFFLDPIKKAGDFQKSLNVLWATADHGKVTLSQVSAEAIKLGNDAKLPAVSAKDAADAMLELAKGGFTAKQSMAGARGTLLLATAAQIENADAATYLADALHGFGLQASDAARVTDLLAGAANRSTSEIPQVAQALSQVGSSAHALNVPIQDTVAAIVQLSNAGVKGSDAGTSLKTALQRLIPTTTAAKKEVKALGINVADSHGNFVGLHNVIGQYTKALKDKSPVERASILNTIFGADAQRAANILLVKGVKAFDDNRAAISRRGQAQKLADAQTKGFNGALNALANTFDTLQLKLGLKLLPYMTRFVGFLADVSGSKNLHVAIDVAVKGIKSFAGDLSDMLFGSSKTITIGGEGRATRVVVDPGLVAGLQASMAQLIATTDWSAIGTSIGSAISKSVKFSETAFNGIYDAGLAWANSHSGQLAEIGAVIGLKVVQKLLDPSFWLQHWQLIGGIALSVIPAGKFASIGGKIAEVTFGRFGGLISDLVVKGLSKLPEAIGAPMIRATEAMARALGSGGANVVKAAINIVLNVISAISRRFGALGPLVKLLLNTGLVTAIVSVSSAAFNAAVHLAERVAAGIKTAPSKLVGLAGDLVSKIGSALDNASGKALGLAEQIGRSIAQGVVNGLSNLGDAAFNKMKAGLDYAKNKIKSVYAIFSPSRVYAKEIGMPLVAGILAGVDKGQLGPTLGAKLAQGIREAIVAGKKNLVTLATGVGSSIGDLISAGVDKATNPLSDIISGHQSARQLRDLTASRDAAAAANAAGPQTTATDADGNPIPLTAQEAAQQAHDLNQTYMDAQQDLDDFMLQSQIDAAQKQAAISTKSVNDQIANWTYQFNTGAIKQGEYLSDITTLVNTYATGDGATAFGIASDLLGQAFVGGFKAQLSDLSAQIQAITQGGQLEGGAAIGDNSAVSSSAPVSARIAAAQADLKKQRAAQSKANGDIDRLAKRVSDLKDKANDKGSAGGTTVTKAEQASIDAAQTLLTAARKQEKNADAQGDADAALIKSLTAILAAAVATDPAIAAAIAAGNR